MHASKAACTGSCPALGSGCRALRAIRALPRLPPPSFAHPAAAPSRPQANRPVPSKQLVFYFEVTILDAGELGKIGVGFTPRDVKLTRQPG